MAAPNMPLNAPVAKTHRANKRPLVIAGAAVAIMLILGARACVVKLRSVHAAVADTQTDQQSAEPATDAAKELWSKEPDWSNARPAATSTGADVTDAMKGVAGTVNKGIASAVTPLPNTQQSGTQGWPAIQAQQQQMPPLYVQQQSAAQSAKDEEKAAWESPLVKADAPTPTVPGVPLIPQTTNAPAAQPATGTEYDRQNLTASKLAFAGESDKRTPIFADQPYVSGPCAIRAGWDIPAILQHAVNSGVPGNLRARVRENVYDTDTGKCLVIPQNSLLVGTFNSDLSYAQDRLQVKWTQLSRPGTSTIYLDQMGGVSADGAAGLSGHVNNHLKRVIGFAALSSLFAAGIQISQNHGGSSTLAYPSAGQVAGGAVGQQLGEFGQRVTEKNMNVPPTFTEPAGYRFNVRVDRDMIFAEPYRRN